MYKAYSLCILFFIFGLMTARGQESYNVLMYRGNQNFNSKNYDNASSYFMEAAKKKNNFGSHYNLGNSLYKRKMYDQAKAEYGRAYDLAQNNDDKVAALYNMGNTEMRLNNPEKAAKLYKKALMNLPYNESIQKNYRIAVHQQKKKNKKKNGPQNSNNNDQDSQQGNKNNAQPNNQGNKPTPQNGGQNEQNQGKGNGKNESQNQPNDGENMPKYIQNQIMKSIQEKEKETAKRILNKSTFVSPQSNAKDW
ncbi:tetratricopeptide repeat protein [Riemerella columbipharyngis]|uniref:Tetratricopeptide repeat-containing protein n=1 Tax=Riemerella columbipharyngis TaxID=1071918 RepID=A0A1G6Y2B4_9FLAO|nr:tetratricopeptide repeat protein [Riemerella columbipharyngis]SDD84480.1 Tetratricopeptide repeat-containing protein [Riemerella columbipharyngis]